MANINEILARAAALRQETALNSIDPERAGGIMYDTLLALNELWLQQGAALVISKIYASVAAMNADTSPVSDLTGKPIRPGMVVVIASSDSDNGSVYRYNSTSSPRWSLVGKIGNITPEDSLTSDSTQLPLAAHQGKVLDGKISQLGQKKVDVLPGKNLFNPKEITEGYFLNSSGGRTTQESRFYSGYIEVSPSQQYHISSNGDNNIDSNSNVCYCFYKDDETFISSVSTTNLTTTSPANAKYLRISGLISYIDSIQVEKGSARTEYAKFCPIDGYLNESSVISDRLSNKLSALPGINLFDKRKSVAGKFLNSFGGETSNANYEITDYISIEPSTNYYLSKDGDDALSGNSNTSICFYDENKELLSSGGIIPATTKAVTTPATAKYLRASIALPEDYVQIEKGSARTEYTAYSDIGGYTGDIISSLQDIQKYKPVIKLYPAIKTLAAVCFVWDDGSVKDDDLVSVFNEYGAKCGFALIGYSSFENYAHNLNYLKYQKQGFSCLNHNSSGDGLPSYANEAAARAAVVLAKNRLEQFGLTINGFVCPNNAYVDDYRTMLGTFHAYAFGGSSISYNNRQSDVLKLVRTVIEPDSTSLQTIKDTIDAACADGGFISFYGHAARIGTSGYHDMSFYRDVLSYINNKRDAGLCYFDNPDNCVKYYFGLEPLAD